MEFRGVVNINAKGDVVCFCSQREVLQGKCACHKRDDCPEAVISVEVLEGTRPSEKNINQASKTISKVTKSTEKIKEGLSKLEQAVKKTKFRL
jgi:hypothetical protein